MTQFSFPVIDPNLHNGSQVASWLNSFMPTAYSQQSGPTRPSYALPGLIWVDTSTNPNAVVNLFDGTRDIPLSTIVGGVVVLDPRYVPKTGGTMSGQLAIRMPADNGGHIVIGSAGRDDLVIDSFSNHMRLYNGTHWQNRLLDIDLSIDKGTATFPGGVTAGGALISSAGSSQLRAVVPGGNSAFLVHVDTANAYIMDTSGPYGGWTGHRPFMWNFASGAVTIAGAGETTTLGGHVQANANVYVSAQVRGAQGVFTDGDFGFFQSGTNRYFRWANAWVDYWDMNNGNRGWLDYQSQGLMSLSGGGALWTKDSVTTNYLHCSNALVDGTITAGAFSTGGVITAGGFNTGGNISSNGSYANYVRSNGDISVGATVTANVVNANGMTSYGDMRCNGTSYHGALVSNGPIYARHSIVDIGWEGSGYKLTSGGSNRYINYAEDGWLMYWEGSSGTWCWRNNYTEVCRVEGGNGNFTVQYGNGFKPGGGAWAYASDARIKDVEGDYTQGLDAICALRPKIYRFKKATNLAVVATGANVRAADLDVEDTRKKFYGPIAQDIELVMPETVTEGEQTIGDITVPDMRTFDGSAVTWALCNAVRELADRINALENSR